MPIGQPSQHEKNCKRLNHQGKRVVADRLRQVPVQERPSGARAPAQRTPHASGAVHQTQVGTRRGRAQTIENKQHTGCTGHGHQRAYAEAAMTAAAPINVAEAGRLRSLGLTDY